MYVQNEVPLLILGVLLVEMHICMFEAFFSICFSLDVHGFEVVEGPSKEITDIGIGTRRRGVVGHSRRWPGLELHLAVIDTIHMLQAVVGRYGEGGGTTSIEHIHHVRLRTVVGTLWGDWRCDDAVGRSMGSVLAHLHFIASFRLLVGKIDGEDLASACAAAFDEDGSRTARFVGLLLG